MQEKDPRSRIVVAGMGIVSPLGNGLEQNWQALIDGQSGIRTIPEELRDDAYEGKIHTAAIPQDYSDSYLKDMVGDDLDHTFLRSRHLSTKYLLAATAEALQQAGLCEPGSITITEDRQQARRIGVVAGSGASGADNFAGSYQSMLRGRMNKPTASLAGFPHDPAAATARAIGAARFSTFLAGACASGNMAIIAGVEKFKSRNDLDIVVVGGTEAQINKVAFNIFAPMGPIDPREDPDVVSSPFSIHRRGFTMSAGAGALVLMRMDYAQENGIEILAEITGRGESNDIIKDHEAAPQSEGIKEAITEAIAETREVDGLTYINAHATATLEGDPVEMGVIRELFDEKNTVVTSTKANIGHGLGAAGAWEAIFCVLALRTGQVPPQIKGDESTQILEAHGYVPWGGKSVKGDFRRAVNNSFGFGGVDEVTVFEKVD